MAGLVLHGSCVSLAGRGLLVLGAAGSGKSTLALQLLTLGADLVADDRVALTLEDGRVMASAPAGLPPLIEARGVGLLNAPLIAAAPLRLVVDLDQAETERLPPKRNIRLLDQDLPLVHGPLTGHLSVAVRHYLVWGRGD